MKGTHKRLLIVLIKIGIMFLVMTGIILINRSYMKNADGSENEGRKTSLEKVVKPCFIICNQEENLPPCPLLNIIQKE